MRIQLLLTAFLFATVAPLFAQPAEDTPAADEQSEIDKLVEQQNKLADDYNAILRKIKHSDQRVALDKWVAAAKQKLAQAEK